MYKLDDYPYEIRQLTAEEGGGYLVRYTDFWGCMSDGETIEEAISNAREALIAVIETSEVFNLPIPAPHSRKPRIASA